MNKRTFITFFENNIKITVKLGEIVYGKKFSSNLQVKILNMDYRGISQDEMNVKDAAERLYRNDELFWFYIEMGVGEVKDDKTVVYLFVSGHEPVTWDKTINDPIKGNGPFKHIIFTKELEKIISERKRIKRMKTGWNKIVESGAFDFIDNAITVDTDFILNE